MFQSFRRACKGTKIITAVSDIENFDRLRPKDQELIRLSIEQAKSSDEKKVPTKSEEVPTTTSSNVVTDGSIAIDDAKLAITVPPPLKPAGRHAKKNNNMMDSSIDLTAVFIDAIDDSKLTISVPPRAYKRKAQELPATGHQSSKKTMIEGSISVESKSKSKSTDRRPGTCLI